MIVSSLWYRWQISNLHLSKLELYELLASCGEMIHTAMVRLTREDDENVNFKIERRDWVWPDNCLNLFKGEDIYM